MTITKAIELLTRARNKHGETEVYFDCPFCEKSFTPNTLQSLAVHLRAAKEKE